MSRLVKDLFFILVILFRREPELFLCASLIVSNIGDSDLAKNFMMLGKSGGRCWSYHRNLMLMDLRPVVTAFESFSHQR